MQFIFKSDSFCYIHPSIKPREYKSYTKQLLAEAEENTNKIKYSEELFDKVRKESGYKIPANHKGILLVFPEFNASNKSIITDFITNTFKDVEKQLSSEYNEKSDPTSTYDIDDTGKYFGAETKNFITNESFTPKSLCIYVAGCQYSTGDYLVEEFIDNLYRLSEKIDKRKSTEYKIGFNSIRSFLIYNFDKQSFYQIGTHENEIYQKPRRAVSSFDIREYSLELPDAINPLTVGVNFD